MTTPTNAQDMTAEKALEIIIRASWDASWAANNADDVTAAVAFFEGKRIAVLDATPPEGAIDIYFSPFEYDKHVYLGPWFGAPEKFNGENIIWRYRFDGLVALKPSPVEPGEDESNHALGNGPDTIGMP